LKAYLVTREEWIDKGVDVVGHLASKQSLLEEAAADKSRAPMVVDNRQGWEMCGVCRLQPRSYTSHRKKNGNLSEK